LDRSEAVDCSGEAQAVQVAAVFFGGLPHQISDEVVGQQMHVDFFSDDVGGLATKDIHPQRDLDLAEAKLDHPAVAVQRDDLGHRKAAAGSLAVGLTEGGLKIGRIGHRGTRAVHQPDVSTAPAICLRHLGTQPLADRPNPPADRLNRQTQTGLAVCGGVLRRDRAPAFRCALGQGQRHRLPAGTAGLNNLHQKRPDRLQGIPEAIAPDLPAFTARHLHLRSTPNLWQWAPSLCDLPLENSTPVCDGGHPWPPSSG
jgi:hypothetical protein